MNFYTIFTYWGLWCVGVDEGERWVKISRFYIGCGEFLCVSQTGGLAEQLSRKIKSGGNVVFFYVKSSR